MPIYLNLHRYTYIYITVSHSQINSNRSTQTNQMSDQQILPCVMCGQQHEQMLMLVCMHDPCINCAAIHYCTSQANNTNEYPCAKCDEITELDGSSIVELQRVYAQLKGKKRYDYRRGQGSITDGVETKSNSNTNRAAKHKVDTQPKQSTNPGYSPSHGKSSASNYPTSTHQPYTPISQPSYQTNPYSNIKLHKSNEPFYMCQTHPEQQLSYFCFNCNGPICPECAIHGIHREHEVQTTRKAIRTIKDSLKKCQDNTTAEMNNLGGILDSYRSKIKDQGNDVKKEKDAVRECFNQMRMILAEKQKQFQKTIDSCSEANSGLIKLQTQTYDRLIEQHSAVRKNIEQTFKKDDLTILQQYSKREKEANQAVQASKNKRYNPDLDGLKEIDFGLFKDEIDQLTGIMGALKLSVQSKRRS